MSVYLLFVLIGFTAGTAFGGILVWRLSAWSAAAETERIAVSDTHAEIAS